MCIRDSMSRDEKNDLLGHANRYVKFVLQIHHNKLPKSTTCCWRLSRDDEKYKMHQFFLVQKFLFALNISSDVLKGDNAVGATFMSSMFFHATSIPIWTNKDDKFFWGGDLRICIILHGVPMGPIKKN